MKCPQCGSEMELYSHRKIPLQMCYNCGYMEGRDMGPKPDNSSNFAHMKALNFNEMVIFLSTGLKLNPDEVADWLDDTPEQ